MKKYLIISIIIFIISVLIFIFNDKLFLVYERTSNQFSKNTIESRYKQYYESVKERIEPFFKKANALFPPEKIVLIAIKDEKILELYACNKKDNCNFIKKYDILAASGKSGPKLKSGDKQVPEGIYNIEFLNPNSKFHLSLRVNYPNSFDRKMAEKDNRTNLGGDIMIHGSNSSIGCIAIGNDNIEEIFILSAIVKKENIKIIITPTDFRKHEMTEKIDIEWIDVLYENIKEELKKY